MSRFANLRDNHMTLGYEARIRLTGKEYGEAVDAILDAFRKYDDLRRCIRIRMNEHADRFVRSPATLADQVTDVVDWAESQDRVRELLDALSQCNPRNLALGKIRAALVGVPNLESLVASNPDAFTDPARFRQAMLQAEWSVCRVENPEGTPWGTGFLIAPDLLVTNQHVRDEQHANFQANPASVRFRFGSRVSEAGEKEGGRTYGLRIDENGISSWLLRSSAIEQLDYCLVRLAHPVGNEPIAQFPGAPQRSFVSLKPVATQLNQDLFILQHPQGDVLKMATGGLLSRDGAWLNYRVNTLPGSSGSPVFNSNWQLIALHSRAGTDVVNRGVAAEAIWNDLPVEVRALLS